MPKPVHHSEDAEGADAISQLLWQEFKIEVGVLIPNWHFLD